jgi:nicotinamide-nucleotide amidase
MKVEIIAVGSEMLTPDRVDTDSLFITERLNAIGLEVAAKAVVGDDRDTLRAVFEHALQRADLLLITGGLGPTDDDLTRNVVADALGRELEYDPTVFEAIERRFGLRGLRLPEINRRQAMVPAGATVLENRHGTAPGLWLTHGGKTVVLLPGPPFELRPMVDDLVRDRLGRWAGPVRLYRRVLRIAGGSESHVEEAVRPFYPVWAAGRPPITVTILASPGQIDLHFTTAWADEAGARDALAHALADAGRVLGSRVFSDDGRALEQVVGDLLRERGLRIAIAESCTGGLTASRLTDVPGSSDYVDRAVVVYSNRAKVDLLGVPETLIAAHGAVSEPVAEAMAAGVARLAGVEIGVGISGIAGPGGGTPEKPVGTVAVSAAWLRGGSMQVRTRTSRFPGERERVKYQASQAALNLVRRWLLGEPLEEP